MQNTSDKMNKNISDFLKFFVYFEHYILKTFSISIVIIFLIFSHLSFCEISITGSISFKGYKQLTTRNNIQREED